MTNPLNKPIRDIHLGIVQGGQLGRMFLQVAANYGFATRVLDPDAEAPCKGLCDEFIQGDPLDFDAVVRFGNGLDFLTLEYEHVNADALEELTNRGVLVRPSPKILRIVQDKGLQKSFYRDHGLPTADFILVENKAEIEKRPELFPVVQKSRRAGYDGRGVVKLDSISDLAKAFDAPSVLETKVDFEKELSVLIARTAKGEAAIYPVVELEFNPDANLVELLFAPANIEPKIAARAVEIAKELAESLELVGLMAVEMFLTPNGELLINEIAPRAHNSGHHTIEANATSQFEQQLRAAVGLPLGSVAMRSPAAMVNLLGASGHQGPARYEGIERAMERPDVHLHIYGKRITKPFRKMGHATVLAATTAEATSRAREIQEILRVVSANPA